MAMRHLLRTDIIVDRYLNTKFGRTVDPFLRGMIWGSLFAFIFWAISIVLIMSIFGG